MVAEELELDIWITDDHLLSLMIMAYARLRRACISASALAEMKPYADMISIADDVSDIEASEMLKNLFLSLMLRRPFPSLKFRIALDSARLS